MSNREAIVGPRKRSAPILRPCVPVIQSLSGQIGLIPETMRLAEESMLRSSDFPQPCGDSLCCVQFIGRCSKDQCYLLDMGNFARVNEIMAGYFKAPYPARAAAGVASAGALVESSHPRSRAVALTTTDLLTRW
jgi:hypothetical protein